MVVDTQTVKRIASLAKLKSDDDKVKDAEGEFNKILDWIEQLNEVDTNHVEPLLSVNDENLRLREDKVSDGNQRDAVLANAPMSSYGYFVVPKVVE